MSMPFGYVSPEQITKDKADFARKGIARGRPLVVLEYTEGIAFVADNPSTHLHKIGELYDRIALAAVGRVSEFENLRVAGVRLADVRGYSYDREDVRARDIANGYSQALSTIFTQQMKPYEVEILVAEVADDHGRNELYHILFDGTVTDEHGFVGIGGHADTLTEALKGTYQEGWDLPAAIREAASALSSAEGRQIEPASIEAGVLDRTRPQRRKFRRLSDDEVERILAG